MFARVISVHATASQLDDAVEIAQQQPPGVRGQQGYQGFYVLADRSSDKLMTISLWESRETSMPSRHALRPAGLGGPGGADGIQRVGLTLTAAVLAVGAVPLHDPDTGGGHVAGQAGAVAAGALDPDQAHGPEPAQPVQQAGIAGRVTGNSWTPSRPPMGSSAAATCTSAWVSTPPVMVRVSTMVNAISFL